MAQSSNLAQEARYTIQKWWPVWSREAQLAIGMHNSIEGSWLPFRNGGLFGHVRRNLQLACTTQLRAQMQLAWSCMPKAKCKPILEKKLQEGFEHEPWIGSSQDHLEETSFIVHPERLESQISPSLTYQACVNIAHVRPIFSYKFLIDTTLIGVEAVSWDESREYFNTRGSTMLGGVLVLDSLSGVDMQNHADLAITSYAN
ncbi:hypothetical protein VNO77_26685 [Canavalia gladiata]|uniref:Uncharacterized protein n=1 Tax=Canavalia gladiata TaxID=3824 RepID=A0AAN9KSQ7_CANGL